MLEQSRIKAVMIENRRRAPRRACTRVLVTPVSSQDVGPGHSFPGELNCQPSCPRNHSCHSNFDTSSARCQLKRQ